MAATQSRPRPDPRAPSPEAPLELWGGVECTHNRVGDGYLCQLARSGHDRRLADLDAIAALGLRTLRYPLLWERTAPRGLEHADWTWTDERFTRLRELFERYDHPELAYIVTHQIAASIDWRRTFASKFSPPVVKPPIFRSDCIIWAVW